MFILVFVILEVGPFLSATVETDKVSRPPHTIEASCLEGASNNGRLIRHSRIHTQLMLLLFLNVVS